MTSRIRVITGWRAVLNSIPLLVLACTETYDAPKTARPDMLPAEEYPQVAVSDDLEDDILVTRAMVEETAPLSVTVVLRNRDDDEREVQYRFFFLDPEGLPEESDPDWHWLHMPSRTELFVKSNALDTRASAWRMEVRPAR